MDRDAKFAETRGDQEPVILTPADLAARWRVRSRGTVRKMARMMGLRPIAMCARPRFRLIDVLKAEERGAGGGW